MSITVPVLLSMRETRQRKHQLRKLIEAKLGHKIGRRTFELYLRQEALRQHGQRADNIPENETEGNCSDARTECAAS